MDAKEIQNERLKNYIEAEKKTLENQEYKVDGINYRRADLGQIGQGINSLLASGTATNGNSRNKRMTKVILKDY